MALKVKLVKNQAMSNIDLSPFDDGKSIIWLKMRCYKQYLWLGISNLGPTEGI